MKRILRRCGLKFRFFASVPGTCRTTTAEAAVALMHASFLLRRHGLLRHTCCPCSYFGATAANVFDVVELLAPR